MFVVPALAGDQAAVPHPKGCTTNIFPISVMCSVLFIISLLFAASALGAPRDEKFIKVPVEAKAPGTGIEARIAATRNAQHEILAQILKTSLALEDASTIDSLLKAPERYIRSTQLLRYDTVGNETRVEVEVFVNRNQLLKDAAALILPRMPSPPKVLVLVAEQAPPNPPLIVAGPGTAEREIGKALANGSFEVVDPASVRASHTEAELLAAIKGDNQTAGEFARQGFADVLVLGEAEVSAEPSTSGQAVPGTRGKVTLRVFRARDGKCIDTLTREAVVHSANPAEGAAAAFEDACAKLTEDALVLCVMAVAGQQHARDELIITLEDPGARSRFDAFTEVLAKATGEQAPEVLFYSDRLARVRARYAGSMVPLMDALTSNAYEGLTLEVQKALQRDVTMRFVKRP